MIWSLAFFARDIAANDLDPATPSGLLLAQLALLGQHPPHRMFALDTMYEQTPAAGGDHAKLIALTGSVDVFGVEDLRLAQGEVERLNGVLSAAQAAASQPNSELSAAQANVTRLAAELADVRKYATEAHTALAETHAEIARRGAVIEAAQAAGAQLAAALAETHAEITRRGAVIETAQAEAARLAASLVETYTEIERRGAVIHAALAESGQLAASLASEQGALARSDKMRTDAEARAEHAARALRALQIQLDDLARSRSYRLVKLLKPLRARIEQIAATIRSGLRS